MPTEEQRKWNREKQKRWRAKNRDRLRARRQYQKLFSGKVDGRDLRAGFRTFELSDPRDTPELIPRLIGLLPRRTTAGLGDDVGHARH